MPCPEYCCKSASMTAATLGPLPHARLNIERGADNRGPADREKKQTTRMLKAECEVEGRGFIVRVAASQVKNVGPPLCPKHGAMSVDLPEDEGEQEAEAGELRSCLNRLILSYTVEIAYATFCLSARRREVRHLPS